MQVAKRRRGIPQLLHPHTLAMGGLEALEAMLPGFQAEVKPRAPGLGGAAASRRPLPVQAPI